MLVSATILLSFFVCLCDSLFSQQRFSIVRQFFLLTSVGRCLCAFHTIQNTQYDHIQTPTRKSFTWKIVSYVWMCQLSPVKRKIGNVFFSVRRRYCISFYCYFFALCMAGQLCANADILCDVHKNCLFSLLCYLIQMVFIQMLVCVCVLASYWFRVIVYFCL